jgi:hypothetical protein
MLRANTVSEVTVTDEAGAGECLDELPGVAPVAVGTDVCPAAPHAASVMLAPNATTQKLRRVLGVAMVARLARLTS